MTGKENIIMKEINNEKRIFSVRDMAIIAISAAILCVAAPFVVPLGAVPLSLATLAVYISGAVLGAKRATAAVVIYLLLGAVGMPVFAGATGGIAQLFGATGGFLFGYIPCALITGLAAEKKLPAVGMTVGTLSCYAVGTLWFTLYTSCGLWTAVGSCVLPFIVGDALKIIAAVGVSSPIRQRLLPIINKHN